MGSFKQKQELRAKQNLLLSLSMRQAFEVLQMPVLELEEWVELEIEKNPVLEADYSSNEESNRGYSGSPQLSSQKKAYLESLLSYPASLYETLKTQARLCFDIPQELSQALSLIDHLDEKGFLSVPLEEIKDAGDLASLKGVLATLQTFDPVGIGARTVQESLLIQLRHAKKQMTLAYQVLLHHYEDLLHGRYTEICATLGLKREELQRVIEADIAVLSPHPAGKFTAQVAPPLIPDFTLDYQEGHWSVTFHSSCPSIHLSSTYQEYLKKPIPRADKRRVQKYYTQGKWLLRMLQMREDTLRKIAHYLIAKQGPFLKGESSILSPIRVQEMAEHIGVHPSTAARAIKNKHLACPSGVLPVASLFPRGLLEQHGTQVASHTVKDLLKQLIEQEDKKQPLSDEHLTQKLKMKGIPCARRTIAKYRKLLRIPPAFKRK